jgi:small-conductance mechanosensitive channel
MIPQQFRCPRPDRHGRSRSTTKVELGVPGPILSVSRPFKRVPHTGVLHLIQARLPRALAALGLLLLLSAGGAFAQQGADAVPADSSARAGYGALADVLEDEPARRAIIEDLRRMAQPQGAPPPIVAEPSLAQRLAATTRGIAEGAAAEVGQVYEQIVEPDGVAVGRFNVQATIELAGVMVVVFAIFCILRLAARPIYRRASATHAVATTAAGRLRAWLVALGCGLIDVGVVVLAWLAGYAAALFLIGDGTQMHTRQSLFLNAFLIVEITKALVRVVFAKRYKGLRLLRVGDEDAAYWSTWLTRMTSLLGYGILLVAPVLALDFGQPAASLVSLVVHLTAFVAGVIIVRQNREPVRHALEARAHAAGPAYVTVVLVTLARIWHILAILYLAVLFGMLFLRPETALTFIAAATLKSIIAIAVGVAVSAAVGKAIAFGIRLPEERRRSFPMLEERLNAFVPATLKVLRIVIALVVLAVILDAWYIFDAFGWVTSETGAYVFGRLISVALIVVLACIVWLVVSSWIEHRLREDIEPGTGASARERTLLTIFRNAFTIALVVITAMITLSEIGINIGPLLAGAGVLGLAIGFGAQKLVQDVITGVFIQLENAMNTGDVVTAGPVTGSVEKLTVRSVGIRDLHGTYHLIPFSSVDTVSNFMKGFSYHVGEYGVAYREDVEDVISRLKDAFEELRANPDHAAVIVGDLEIHGVTALADSSVNVRVRIKTLPGKQWGLGRAYNGLVKKHFDAAGIEIPFPHMTVYFGEDKKGKAPAAPIRLERTDDPAILPPDPKRGTGKRHRRSSGEEMQDGPELPSEEEV